MGTELHQPYLTFCNPMEIQPVHPKRVQSWVFTGKTDVEAETPILWAPDAKSELTQSKRPWCWERLRAGEGDDRGWNGWMASPTQWTWVWVSSGSWWCRQGSLACCSPLGGKESDTTEWLNWAELNWITRCLAVFQVLEIRWWKEYNRWQSSGRYMLLESQFCTRQDMQWPAYGCSEKRGRWEKGNASCSQIQCTATSSWSTFFSHRLKPRKSCRSWATCRNYFTRDKWVWWNWQPDRLAQCNPWPPILSPPPNGCHQKSASPPPWVSYLGKEVVWFYVSSMLMRI